MSNFRIVMSGLGGILVLIILIPLVRVIATSDPAVLRATISDPEVIHSILLTLSASWWATLACLMFGVPLAYALARWNFPGKAMVQGVIDLPVMIPHTAAGIALLMVYGPEFLLGRAFARWASRLPAPSPASAWPWPSCPCRFWSTPPGMVFWPSIRGLERVARTLGASPWQAFFRVSLALSWRSVLSGAIMMWARGIAEFGAVVILAYHPMVAPILIWERFQNYGLKYASPVAVILILLCLVIFSGLRWLAVQKKET